MKQQKKTYSVKLDPEHLKILEEKGISVTKLVQDFIAKSTKQTKCPVCNQQLKQEVK